VKYAINPSLPRRLGRPAPSCSQVGLWAIPTGLIVSLLAGCASAPSTPRGASAPQLVYNAQEYGYTYGSAVIDLVTLDIYRRGGPAGPEEQYRVPVIMRSGATGTPSLVSASLTDRNQRYFAMTLGQGAQGLRELRTGWVAQGVIACPCQIDARAQVSTSAGVQPLSLSFPNIP
jgi:hypothetical protein